MVGACIHGPFDLAGEVDLRGDNFDLLHGWVNFVLVVALYAWKGGNLAELAEQPDTMVEHQNQSRPNNVVTNQSCHPVDSGLPDYYIHKARSSILRQYVLLVLSRQYMHLWEYVMKATQRKWQRNFEKGPIRAESA